MPRTHYRWTTAEPYIQDTWKIRPSLTASLAFAWYASTPPNPSGVDKNLVHGFDFQTGAEIFAALGQMNPEVFNMTWTNFAPRAGLSWQPKFLGDAVVRAGAGIYYTTQMALNQQYSIVSQIISVNNSIANTQPTPTYLLGTNTFPPVTVGQITQAQVPTITGPIQYLSMHQRSPYVEQWTVDIAHTFGKSYVLDAAYIGNQAHQQEHGRRAEHHGLDNGIVAAKHAIDDHLAKAGYGKNLFGQHRSRQQRCRNPLPPDHRGVVTLRPARAPLLQYPPLQARRSRPALHRLL